MTNASGPIYEVAISIDREVLDQFDTWLALHVDEMLEIDGIYRAEVFEQEDDEQGRARRITIYYFVSDADLEQYLSGRADTMRQSAIDRFGGQFEASRRVLRHTDIVDGDIQPVELCLNCGTALGGQYCGNCGQRAASRLISVWELLKDAFGDLFDVDSRLWRTIVPLLIRPGKLTRDYLEGRRARFMPPFRMYLVLSIVFFLVAFFDPREELSILFEPGTAPATESGEEASDPDAVRDEVIRELAEEGIIVDQDDADDDRGELTVSIDSGDESDENCDIDEFKNADLPDWLASRLTPERLKIVCDRVVADDGRAFLDKLLDNVPAALFVLLPLMALVLKVLYPLSKRYYVEHLLFVVHYHAFVFLMLSLMVFWAQLGSLIRIPEPAVDVIIFAAAIYVPVYLYKSQRRVYGQGRFFTILKFLMLTFAYFAGLLLMLAIVGIFAAFSI